MATWTEGRGYTLILTHSRGPDRYVRVALVRKRTLFGPAFNVREARAEDAARSGREPEALGIGRMLSWRWLGEREAEQLLAARLRTLETLGYVQLDKQATANRGPWDWLRDLVARQLQRAAELSEQVTEAEPHVVANELRESLERLGLEPQAVLEGLASILELDPASLRAPTIELLAKLEPELLAILLPVWIEHESSELREIGKRWLALPTTPYELDHAVLERWVNGNGRMAAALAPRLEREALALLGPEALARLAHTASNDTVKQIAARWQTRLQT
jgi:hypothetical protein